MAKTQFFIRDDDVGALTPELVAFMDLFARQRLPVSYQIIPDLLTEACAQSLVERKRGAPGLFEFSQHGLTHQMIVGGESVNYEFGPERSYDEQLFIIRRGQEILKQGLGDCFSPDVFTPPQHKYDANTLKALLSLNVKVISASCYVKLRHRVIYKIGRRLKWTTLGRSGISYHGNIRRDEPILELSISVPVDDGRVRMGSVDAVMGAVNRARRHTSVVGLMFHHAVYKTPEDHEFLSELIGRFSDIDGADFSSIGQIAALRDGI